MDASVISYIITGSLTLILLLHTTIMIIKKLKSEFRTSYLFCLILLISFSIFFIIIITKLSVERIQTSDKISNTYEDILNAQEIGTAVLYGVYLNQLPGAETDIEVTNPKVYEVLLKNMIELDVTKKTQEIPKVKIKESYKWFISYNSNSDNISKDIVVKAGESPQTAITLYPEPAKIQPPYYDVNNMDKNSGYWEWLEEREKKREIFEKFFPRE